MAAQEETTQRAVFVDTSNEPRTDEEAVSMCTQGLERATAPQDIADLQFRLANAQVRRGFLRTSGAHVVHLRDGARIYLTLFCRRDREEQEIGEVVGKGCEVEALQAVVGRIAGNHKAVGLVGRRGRS